MSITAYEQAWEAYHRYGEPGWPFHEVLAEHFRHGAVICTPDAFVMARRVNVGDPDDFHLSPLEWRENGDCWMVWLAAGRLESLTVMAEIHPAGWISYQRRDSMRLRRVKTADFFRHVLAKDSQTDPAAAYTAARVCHWSGKGPGGSGSAPPRAEPV